MSSESQFKFSPSLYHQQLMKDMDQKLAYKGGDVKAWQNELRPKVQELLGLDLQDGKRIPLNVQSLWKREHEFGTIEKIVFDSEPEVQVPAYVCLPKDVAPPYKFFVCLQGHSTGMHNSIAVAYGEEEKSIEIEGDRDFGLICMKNGIAAICIEQRSFGERREGIQEKMGEGHLCYQAAVNAIMLGKTLLGERIFDIDRAIDYLESRGDVDMEKLGVMGNSGGGTATTFSAAVLPRIKFAMPSCSFSTFQASIMSMFHCCCNFVPGLLEYAESSDVLGLFAPKPLVVVSGIEDGIFPIKEARQEFAKLKKIYAAMGAEDKCHHVEGEGGHRFYADQAWPVMLEELAK